MVTGSKYKNSYQNFDLLILRYNSDGTLDTAFGTNGAATYSTSNDNAGYSIALQPNGKIVVAGESSDGTNRNFLVLRYNTDGTLDPSFGVNGVVTYGNGAGNGIAMQSDGKIVVAGESSSQLLVLRYAIDGTLDITFGTYGVAIYDVPTGESVGNAIAIQADQKIVVTGESSNDLLILRYNIDGTLDTTFGNNGVVTFSGTPTHRLCYQHAAGYAVAIQTDGKIVVAGEKCGDTDNDVLVLRYNGDGTPDTVFGVVTEFGTGHADAYNAVALQADDKIVAVGKFGHYLATRRYNDNGTIDSSFGTGYRNEWYELEAEAISIQADGKIVFVGSQGVDIFVVRCIVKLEQAETINVSPLSGPNSGKTGKSYTFSTSGSSTQGDSIEYRFDWGDGTFSDWSSTGSASKSWFAVGVYSVKAQARCIVHRTITGWSNPLIVNILFAETVSTPSVLYGPTNGIPGNSYPYITGGSTSNLGDSLQYLFDWGDGTNSGWLPVGTTSASHSWAASGTYLVKAQARCSTDTNVISSWSGSLTVNIASTTQSYTITTNPSGLQITVDGTAYTASQTFNWTPDSSHTLSVSSPQSGTAGTRYVYSSWSDGGAQTHTIIVPSSSTTYTATFSNTVRTDNQYLPSGWWDSYPISNGRPIGNRLYRFSRCSLCRLLFQRYVGHPDRNPEYWLYLQWLVGRPFRYCQFDFRYYEWTKECGCKFHTGSIYPYSQHCSSRFWVGLQKS